MKVSYNWLKDYIELKIAPEKLAAALTMAGLPAESIEKAGDDHIIELEVTANRPDWLSITGIAREVSAITGNKLKLPPAVKHLTPKTGTPINIKIEDEALCARYTGRVIRNVRVADSPAWLKTRIEAMGLRPVNNIVDITNFCLFESGEPMHAFDMDKIEGGCIVVRSAKKGEKITTIDGAEKALDDSMLVIADKARPVAIAGIMGGVNTEVTGYTKNILLEAAYFDPISVRRSSRKLGISTESSYRFERKVDMANIANCSDRATELILKIAGGELGEFIEIGRAHNVPAKSVTLSFEKLNKLLGLGIERDRAENILNALGLKTLSVTKDIIKMEVPTFRYDLNDDVDLIEEIARIYGYEHFPVTIPHIVEGGARITPDVMLDRKIRGILTGFGLDEIITYSLISRKLLDMAHIPSGYAAKIRNPLTSEQEMMRPSLMPGALNSALWNINRKNKDLKLFELGKIYLKEGDDKFIETKHLSIALTGLTQSDWITHSRQAGFYDLKGLCESFLAELGVNKYQFRSAKEDIFSSGICASVEIDGRRIAIMGEINKRVLANYDIKDKVYAMELDVDSLLKNVPPEKRFVELPKYPSIFRDLSIVVAEEILNSDLVGAIASEGGTILKETFLIDMYKGQQIPGGKVGLTYRLEYRDPSRTLEEKDIGEVHARIVKKLDEKFGAKLR